MHLLLDPGSRTRGVPSCLVAALCVLLAGCTSTSAPSPAHPAASGTAAPAASAPVASGSAGAARHVRRKVLVIVEENHTYDEVFGQGRAPYLTRLANTYATITGMDAGYPAACPSLPAYLLMTSGSTHGVCDDAGPDAHPIGGPSIFTQVEEAGGQWRGYAESMPAPCTRENAAGDRYLVRHAPAPYYTAAAARCTTWDLPMGSASAGALHDDVASGGLPDYAFVTPDACHDMHGALGCPGDLVAAGDAWLATWLPDVLAGPDYRSGRLVVVLTWDEGSAGSNHIPTVVVTPTARGVRVTQRVTHCGLLAIEEHVLGLAPLGCAGTAPSPAAALGLAS